MKSIFTPHGVNEGHQFGQEVLGEGYGVNTAANHSTGLGSLLQGLYLLSDPLGQNDFGRLKVVFGLEVHPALGVGAEEACEAQRGVGGDGPFSCADFIDAALGYTDGLCQPVAGDPHRLEEVLDQDFTGVYGWKVAFAHEKVSFNGNR